jgi:hypothetical protein
MPHHWETKENRRLYWFDGTATQNAFSALKQIAGQSLCLASRRILRPGKIRSDSPCRHSLTAVAHMRSPRLPGSSLEKLKSPRPNVLQEYDLAGSNIFSNDQRETINR